MLSLYDRATMAHALTLDLDPRLRGHLERHLAALVTPDGDLTDYTEYLIITHKNTEAEIIQAVGFSPLIEPIEGARYGEPGFMPYWDWFQRHDGWYEMIVTFGSTFAYVLFIADADGVLPELRRLCREYTA